MVLNIPGTLAPTNVGTYQQFNKRNFVVTGVGDSVVNAWTEVQANSFRDIFFGQMRAVVLSERIARKNINDYLDFIGRIPLVPPNTIVLVAKDRPGKTFGSEESAERTSGQLLLTIISEIHPSAPWRFRLTLWRVNAIMDRKTSDPYIPLFEESQESYKIAGTAVFSRNRMVGELSMDETEILALLKGTDNGYLTVPLGKITHVAFKNIRAKTKVRPQIATDGTVTFNVKTEISGNMVENFPHRETLLKEKKKIERQAEVLTKRKIRNLIAKLQGLNSDPVGFGGKIRI